MVKERAGLGHLGQIVPKQCWISMAWDDADKVMHACDRDILKMGIEFIIIGREKTHPSPQTSSAPYSHEHLEDG